MDTLKGCRIKYCLRLNREVTVEGFEFNAQYEGHSETNAIRFSWNFVTHVIKN